MSSEKMELPICRLLLSWQTHTSKQSQNREEFDMLVIQDEDVASAYSRYEQVRGQLIEKLTSCAANDELMSHFFDRVLEYYNDFYAPTIETILSDNQLISKHKTKVVRVINFNSKSLENDFKFANPKSIETYINSFHSNNDRLTTYFKKLKEAK